MPIIGGDKLARHVHFIVAIKSILPDFEFSISPEIKDISSPLTIISGTIECQENSIWRRSRLDLQRVFRTMTYTIRAPQIFYLMKRKIKGDLQINLWDFSRQSDDMMSEF